jgi:broad specificity phosphatase PhoE
VNVFAIRHGETAGSLSGQHTGTTDIPLTDNGRRLAEQIRPVLAKEAFTLVLVSPMQRARETCALAGLGDVAVIDSDLAEWNYGEYEGLTAKQIHEMAPGWLIFRDGCPGGEVPEQVGARVDRVIARAGMPMATLRYSPTDTCCAHWWHGGSGCPPAVANISSSIPAPCASLATTATYLL